MTWQPQEGTKGCCEAESQLDEIRSIGGILRALENRSRRMGRKDGATRTTRETFVELDLLPSLFDRFLTPPSRLPSSENCSRIKEELGLT